MSRLAGVLADATRLLDELGAKCALVGGLAVSARATPRFTRDVDVAVAVSDDAEAERVIHSFSSRGYTVFATVEQRAVGRLATARLIPPGETDDGVVVDLLFASSGLEPEIAGAADDVELFSGVTVPVARTGHLLALKLLSAADDRPQDRIDLVALRDALTSDDRLLAADAIAMIQERGFARDRDLRAALTDLLAS